MTATTETLAWLIERHFNSELRYWTGHGFGSASFDPKVDEAVRFAREQDAAEVLAWPLEGNGRVVQHAFVEGAKP